MTDLLDRIPATLRAVAPPPLRVRYARVGHAGPFDLPRMVLEEDWGAPFLDGDRVCFRRRTRDVTGDPAEPRVVEDALVGYGPDGLVDLGTYDAAGELSRWDPPQVVLPPAPADGATWSAVHTRDDVETTRSVELRADADDPDHLVSVAELRRPDGAMVLRMHFTRGDGFGGYEALIQREGRPPLRTWTEAVTVTTR